MWHYHMWSYVWHYMYRKLKRLHQNTVRINKISKVGVKDTKPIYKTQLHSYTLETNYPKKKLRKPIYRSIKFRNKFNWGDERLVSIWDLHLGIGKSPAMQGSGVASCWISWKSRKSRKFSFVFFFRGSLTYSLIFSLIS